jgi:phosphoglycerate dehydrogenase-like enzyme
MFDAIEPRLVAAGHEVVAYRTEAAFRADETALARADVLLAAGQLSCSREMMASAPALRAIIWICHASRHCGAVCRANALIKRFS